MQKTKVCTKCYKELPAVAEHFYRDKTRKDGLSCRCKQCRREYNIANVERHNKMVYKWRKDNPDRARATSRRCYVKNRDKWVELRRVKQYKKYVIGLYDKLYDQQSGRCAICGVRPDVLYIDHDHITDEIRGLLCRKCNFGIGLFGVDEHEAVFLKAAINYIKKI